MFDLYKDKQKMAYNVMMNEIKNHKLSHAYLIDENGSNEALAFIKEFIKEILYEENKDSLDEFELEVLYKRIEDGNYSEIRIVEPDGQYIKKGQILALQQEFSRKSIEGTRKFYIIHDCDKMRAEAANSMLKFLEEPDNNIIAIMTTNNYNSVLKTIISRCQIVKLVGNNYNVDDSIYKETAFDFIYNLETFGLETVLKIGDILNDKISLRDRENVGMLIDKMIDLYYYILKIKNGIDLDDFFNYVDKLKVICDKNSQDEIVSKINYLIQSKERVKYNVNINLLVDALIVNVGGKNYEGSWS